MPERLRIAWLTTARGPGSYGALDHVLAEIASGLPVDIAVVFINRDEGESPATDRLIERVCAAGVPVETVSSVRYRKSVGGERSRPGDTLPAWRFDYDRMVADRLGKYEFSLGVMFGYMLIATPPLFERFPFVNDHPALPDGPVGTYQQVIAQIIERGERESGCMMNVVSGDVDRGPVVSYCRYPTRDKANDDLWQSFSLAGGGSIEDTALYADIRARGVARERPFMVETLRAIAEHRLTVPPDTRLDLTEVVEATLKARTEA